MICLASLTMIFQYLDINVLSYMRLENLDTILSEGNETETNHVYVGTYANNLSNPFEVLNAH